MRARILAVVWLVAFALATVSTVASALDLHAAVRSGDVEAVRGELNGGADIDAADNWGRTPLIVALQQGKAAVVELLLARGANVAATDAWGRTPLLVAAQLKNAPAVRQLLARKSDPNAANKNDITPLIAAAQMGSREMAGVLLAAGAALEREDNLGRSALMWAAFRKDETMVRMLLERGADAGRAGRDGLTALDLARNRGADASLVAVLTTAQAAVPQRAAGALRRQTEAKRPATLPARKLSPQFDPARVIRGEAKAAITLFEYTDFQCPYCRYGAKTVEEVMARYEGQVRLVVKHLPLPLLHPMAMACARYFEAIALQAGDQAWAFYDRVFVDQAALVGGEPYLRKLAADLGADLDRLDVELRGPVPQARVAADLKESEQYRFDGVPVFVVGGYVIEGAQPAQAFFDVIEAILRM